MKSRTQNKRVDMQIDSMSCHKWVHTLKGIVGHTGLAVGVRLVVGQMVILEHFADQVPRIAVAVDQVVPAFPYHMDQLIDHSVYLWF